ncbi:uncharacterized protein LOC123273860 [Cotesia glomerata]|uniref:uncharacterized protein LOC123273860 n=1 Tax=Cotesia glomerata TaxID=32391 RepID=UPI001D00EDEA|nr:uncharacterized protein LOC123273860 [Cotesia glomerata]
MASFDDTVLPVAWSFMSRKSKPCYCSVVNHFKQVAPHLQVLSVTTDFEVGLRSVFRTLYPNAVLKGCYFHFVQALMKKAKKKGLLDVLNDWDDGKDFFRKIITLALLPSHQIILAFNWLLTVYSAFQPAFYQFLQYFQSYWLETIKPENFSVFGCLEKTNNYVESNNRRLNELPLELQRVRLAQLEQGCLLQKVEQEPDQYPGTQEPFASPQHAFSNLLAHVSSMTLHQENVDRQGLTT